jgi:hypothetical protein
MRNGTRESRLQRCKGKMVTEIPSSINYNAFRRIQNSNGSHPNTKFWVINETANKGTLHVCRLSSPSAR